jgi:hypothetical protein
MKVISTEEFYLGDGKLVNTVEGESYKENQFALGEMALRYKCDVCGNTDKTKWTRRSRRAKGKTDGKEYKYVEIICLAKRENSTELCWAKSDLGSYQDGSGNYWKKFERFEVEGVKPTTPNRTSKDLSIEDYSA